MVQVLFSVECSGEPVTTITAGDITLSEAGAEVSPAESDWDIEPHSASLETYTLLMIDVSTSIIDAGTLEVAREVAVDFATALVDSNQLVSVAVFDGDAAIRTVVDFTDDIDELTDGIDGIDADDQLDGSTNLNGAVLAGLDVLDAVVVPDVEAELVSVANLVIFTDGADRANRETDTAARNAVNASDHQVFVVGLVTDDAVEDLEALAPDGFFQASEPDELFDTFETLVDELVAEVNKYYRLRYCSPLRRPRTTLKIDVLHDEKRSTIKYTYPTKDFAAGCTID